MDLDARRTVTTTRWLAWAVAGLLVAGVVSAGTVTTTKDNGDQRIVAATGSSTGLADAPTSTTAPAPPATTLPPPTVLAPTTSAVKPVPTTSAPVRTTVTTAQPPRTTATGVPATTTSTVPAQRAMVTVANDYTHAVTLTLSGREFVLAPGQQEGPFEYALEPNGNDSVGIRLVAVPECGLGDAGGIFRGPGSWRLAVVTSPGACVGPSGSFPGPAFRVTPA